MAKFYYKSLFLALIACLTACVINNQDEFPLRHPKTGEEVICYSGAYNFAEGAPQMLAAQTCISACEYYGYRRFTGNSYTDTPNPKPAPDSATSYIPPQCRAKIEYTNE